MTCIFQESGWMDGKSVNKAKLSEYLDHFSSEHPDWTAAIQHAKTTCLVPNLPAQGFHLNCPAYDVVTCVFRSFVWVSEMYFSSAKFYLRRATFCERIKTTVTMVMNILVILCRN